MSNTMLRTLAFYAVGADVPTKSALEKAIALGYIESTGFASGEGHATPGTFDFYRTTADGTEALATAGYRL